MTPTVDLPPTMPAVHRSATATGVSASAVTVWDSWQGASAHSTYPVSRQPLAEKFRDLAETWRRGRGPHSSHEALVLSVPYQRIIALGPAAIPLIINEMRRNPDHWFWALHVLTGVNPVIPQHYGDLRAMTADWLTWAAANGY